MWIVCIGALAAEADPLLTALQAEMERTTSAYAEDPERPYYLSYRVEDARQIQLGSRYGQPEVPTDTRARTLDVSARVGSPERDSTHELRGASSFSGMAHLGDRLPIDGTVPAIQAVVWAATNKEVRDAQERWKKVQTDQKVRVAEKDTSADFSDEPPVQDLRDPATIAVDTEAWQATLNSASRILDARSDIHWSRAALTARGDTQYLVGSDGTAVRHGRSWYRLSLESWARAEDGSTVHLYRWQDVHDPTRLPAPAEVDAWAGELAAFTEQVVAAPSGEPYDGPVLLRGRAAGVFVHEVLGHRVEGHRQKGDDEGQTFKDKVGERLLPEAISIVDDPTVARWEGMDLNGHYAYDQQGVPGQRAVLVEDGVFKGFLMSREPIEGFQRSNGHGRAQAWRQPVARMANTIVTTKDPQSFERLRARLREEARAQGREYGLLIDEIGGGFTLTGRMMPNAFNVRATYAWRVFADGRPDELVRGVDLVGTPLVALSQVIAAGDDPGVFNGFCGAESGSVPNSAVSPSLLLRKLEVQRKEKGSDRPPLLPKPTPGGDT